MSTILVCTSAATLCLGQDRQQRRIAFEALDLNHDGTLSADEIKASSTTLLTLDRNSDGMLTADELTPRPENAGAAPDELVKQLMSFDKTGKGYLLPADLPERMQRIFTRADTNHDGKLTPDEIQTLSAHQGMPVGIAPPPGRASGLFRMDPILNALDTNHDGVLSAEEIAAAPASLAALDKNSDGELTAEEIRVRQQTPEERVDHVLGEFDADKDGKLSRAETPDRLAPQFDAIDKNSDGYLDKAELAEYFKNQASQPRPGAPREGTPTAPRN